MAPWPGQIVCTGLPESPDPPNLNIRHISPNRVRDPSLFSDADILEYSYGIPTLYPSPDNHQLHNTPPEERRPSRHGRSMSHPFPSIFHSKKKRQGGNTTLGDDVSDSSGSPILLHHQSSLKGIAGKSGRNSEMDLITGKCMTCDSMVRWPKELSVFRCTVCLTINDLSPIGNRPRGHEQRRNGTSSLSTGPNPWYSSKVKPLSLDKANELIKECTISYLLSRLKHSHEKRGITKESPSSLNRHERNFDSMLPLEGNSEESASIKEFVQFNMSPSIKISRPLDQKDDSSPTVHSMSKLSNNECLIRGTTTCKDFATKESSTPLRKLLLPPKRSEAIANPDAEPDDSHSSSQMAKNIFRPLEEYIVTCFASHNCINSSFSTLRPSRGVRAASEDTIDTTSVTAGERKMCDDGMLSAMDAKTLLLGDVAENGAWWTGERESLQLPDRSRSHRSNSSTDGPPSPPDIVSVKTPRIDWDEVHAWYYLVLQAGDDWDHLFCTIFANESNEAKQLDAEFIQETNDQIMEAQSHVHRVLLKATESLLKRPGGLLRDPNDVRFLLIILTNPLLYPSSLIPEHRKQLTSISKGNPLRQTTQSAHRTSCNLPNKASYSKIIEYGGPGKHSGIIKRVLGLLANLPNESHHHLVAWFTRFPEDNFKRTIELVGSFVTYRLTRQHGKKRDTGHDPTGGLIPSVSASGHSTSAALHAALGTTGQPVKRALPKSKPVVYNDDWQIKAAARVMALLFAANNNGPTLHNDMKSISRSRSHERSGRQRQMVSTSDFYNTLLDYSDLIADFEAWEAKRGKFSFCQYPFFLSIWAKIQIMEHDARRQMEVKAREAFFDSIMTHKTVNQYLVLKVRRECLVEDSLKGVSEVVGAGGEEIKKGLRIEFKGEEGIDAGGLRKEWFLLLVRDVFNPDHGMFVYDEDSRACYFNPNSFETSDQFFLVGVVLGLAIYNSTILDIALPPFAFRKLLAAGPTAVPGALSHAKPTMIYTLDDLAEFRPTLAHGLRQLLEFEGDVEGTFCRDFVADIDRYGLLRQIPLCPDGEKRPVTNANRQEFVDLYVRYLLDTAVFRQFEPFKRGFFTVCGGNALSLFRPDEIELLIRGSDEPLDISSLQAVSVNDHWGVPNPAETEPVVGWFWQSFKNAHPKDQRKLLSFITGSDRIPAMGAANLVIKLSCLGDDCSRFPIARTCFNTLSLWRYSSRQKLELMLWRAVHESEGFGLK